MQAKYDTIGIDYNQTRKADPYIVQRLSHHLRPKTGGLYLDIGCGTGNYTHALQQKGLNFLGIDPSNIMLNKARQKSMAINWRIGTAEDTGLLQHSIDGIIATLTLHHWQDLDEGFREMARVITKSANMVIFTATPEQMEGYWLWHYFPAMLLNSTDQMPSLESIELAMDLAGFEIVETEPYFVKPDLEDLFLYSGKHSPEIYLRPEVRNGISSFSALANENEVKKGLEKLKADIQSQKIREIMRSCENTLGDYLFIVAKKR